MKSFFASSFFIANFLISFVVFAQATPQEIKELPLSQKVLILRDENTPETLDLIILSKPKMAIENQNTHLPKKKNSKCQYTPEYWMSYNISSFSEITVFARTTCGNDDSKKQLSKGQVYWVLKEKIPIFDIDGIYRTTCVSGEAHFVVHRYQDAGVGKEVIAPTGLRASFLCKPE